MSTPRIVSAESAIGTADLPWASMANLAWEVRERAFLIGKTSVGAAALSLAGEMFGGCNVEHRFRCHDIHAEVNAIGTMVAAGQTALRAVLVVAERERFTPCGSCMDWIFQFGGPGCMVAFQAAPAGPLLVLTAHQLMPHYPT